jgi:hypothetical protein
MTAMADNQLVVHECLLRTGSDLKNVWIRAALIASLNHSNQVPLWQYRTTGAITMPSEMVQFAVVYE